ncbi:hypothetical protein FB451DRAFT_1166009 [Mycena latifolia]|nr:hypothetical protein FB451DRAFT_1166009 [Mycena latifolia]
MDVRELFGIRTATSKQGQKRLLVNCLLWRAGGGKKPEAELTPSPGSSGRLAPSPPPYLCTCHSRTQYMITETRWGLPISVDWTHISTKEAAICTKRVDICAQISSGGSRLYSPYPHKTAGTYLDNTWLRLLRFHESLLQMASDYCSGVLCECSKNAVATRVSGAPRRRKHAGLRLRNQ